MVKKVRDVIYVHKSNINALKKYLLAFHFERLSENLSRLDYDYDVLKYDTRSNQFTTICSPDWDTVYEPTVGSSIHYSANGKVLSSRKGGTQVYHNKWQFVSSNYTGFDVLESTNRTYMLENTLDLKDIKHLIGNKKFWTNLLEVNNILI